MRVRTAVADCLRCCSSSVALPATLTARAIMVTRMRTLPLLLTVTRTAVSPATAMAALLCSRRSNRCCRRRVQPMSAIHATRRVTLCRDARDARTYSIADVIARPLTGRRTSRTAPPKRAAGAAASSLAPFPLAALPRAGRACQLPPPSSPTCFHLATLRPLR